MAGEGVEKEPKLECAHVAYASGVGECEMVAGHPLYDWAQQMAHKLPKRKGGRGKKAEDEDLPKLEAAVFPDWVLSAPNFMLRHGGWPWGDLGTSFSVHRATSYRARVAFWNPPLTHYGCDPARGGPGCPFCGGQTGVKPDGWNEYLRPVAGITGGERVFYYAGTMQHEKCPKAAKGGKVQARVPPADALPVLEIA